MNSSTSTNVAMSSLLCWMSWDSIDPLGAPDPARCRGRGAGGKCPYRTARELGLRPPPRPGGRPWTAGEVALLGSAPDAEVAARVGRTQTAVRVMRARLK